MPTADEYQRKHDLLPAITKRLDALRDGTTDWHEWHQTGVLTVRLVESAYIQWGLEDARRREILNMLEWARWLYMKAMDLVPKEQELDSGAIMCDNGLAQALEMRYNEIYPSDQPFSILEVVTAKILGLPESDQATVNTRRTHQLGIAYAFLARSYWQMYLDVGDEDSREHAESNQRVAARLFVEIEHESPDNNEAYRTFLLNMALAHKQAGVPKWRTTYVSPALKLARRAGDTAHTGRALAIGLFGLAGERWVRAQVDTRPVFNSVGAQLQDLRKQHP